MPRDGDATTNTITYSLDDNVGGRFTIDANTGRGVCARWYVAQIRKCHLACHYGTVD